MRNNRPVCDRTMSGCDHTFPPPAPDAPFSIVLLDIIQREYAPLKNAAKILARHAGATPRAARNWLERKCCPHVDHAAELIRNCRAVRDAYRQQMDKTE